MQSVYSPTAGSPSRTLPPQELRTESSQKKRAADAWPVADLFSTKTVKKTQILDRVIKERNEMLNDLQTQCTIVGPAPLNMETYEKNQRSLHSFILNKTADEIKSQFKSYLPESHQSQFIHVICDAAHAYHAHPNAAPLFAAADYFLEKLVPQLSQTSFAQKNKFLSTNARILPIFTIYTNTNDVIRHVPGPGTFGNILFRFTATADIVFSPVFMAYLKETPQETVDAITPQENSWETIQDDKVFYQLGFKKLTDRDAVAHYRWLTEVATPTEFSAYLSRVSEVTAQGSDSTENRKATLQIASSQYWRGKTRLTAVTSPPRSPMQGHNAIPVAGSRRSHERRAPRHIASGHNSAESEALKSAVKGALPTQLQSPRYAPTSEYNIQTTNILELGNHSSATESTSASDSSSEGSFSQKPRRLFQQPADRGYGSDSESDGRSSHRPTPRARRHDSRTQRFDHRQHAAMRNTAEDETSQNYDQYRPLLGTDGGGDYSRSENSDTASTRYGARRGLPTTSYDPYGRPIEVHHHHHYHSGQEKHTVTQNAQTSPMHQRGRWRQDASVHTKAEYASHKKAYVQTAKHVSTTRLETETLPVATPVVEPKPPIVYITPIPPQKMIFFNDRIYKKPKTRGYKIGSFFKKVFSAFRRQ